MATTNDLRNGMVLNLDGNLMSVVEFQHVKPGKGGAFVRTKLKNILTGSVVDKTFRAGEKVEEARVEKRPMQFLYSDGDNLHLMDNQTYEQTSVPADLVGERVKFAKEGMDLSVAWYEGRILSAEVPMFVELEIVETDPGVRGDTAQGGTKPATLEGGAVVMVPLFVEKGTVIKVDTRTSTYIERVS
jgi:elongation factor P